VHGASDVRNTIFCAVPKDPRSFTISRVIEEITRGKRFVFMLMPFGSQWDLFERVRKVVQDVLGLTCIRADDVPGSGFDLLEKVHAAIDKAELIIAEVSEPNPNVFYELGYAVGIQKPVLLLAQRGVDIPSDLKGRELIYHAGDRSSSQVFEKDLSDHLRHRLNTQISLLRDMLEAEI